MPPALKRATVSITDFNPADQRLLRAAFHAFVPFALIGGLENGQAKVIALGSPDGLVPPKDYPAGARVYGLIRIKGIDKAPEEMRLLPVSIKAARK